MEKRIESLLEQLTLEEKIGMLHGDGFFHTKAVERLGIPELWFSDGPMGVRKEFLNAQWLDKGLTDDYVTYLPSNSAIASTWNKEVAYQAGKVLGEEARGRGKDMILAPGINIKRSPLGGRNFEYLSEDPVLTGDLAIEIVKGIQESDVSACVKHFALNNQETNRMSAEVIADERTVREFYLPAFKKTIDEGHTMGFMGAYNRYKGEYCCESQHLLDEILREEWKYDGLVVSDWGGIHHTEEAGKCGIDVDMSVTDDFDQYCFGDPLKKAVEDGLVPMECVDEKVRNVLRLMCRLHMLEGDERQKGSYNTAEHQKVTLEAAKEAIILLKNDKKILPLHEKKNQKVLVIGDNANRIHSCGGGSAEIKALYEITPLMGIKKFLGGNGKVEFVQGYIADDMEQIVGDLNWQADSLNQKDAMGIVEVDEALLKRQKEAREEAAALAAEYETVILVCGQNHLQDLEGRDRKHMKLPYAQDELIEAVLKANPNTILVMVSGTPVEMPWIDQTGTVIWQWYNGMEGGTALAETLYGKVNPSGHLPETLPIRLEDCPAHSIGEFPGGETVDYKEGIFVGYRHYDTRKVPVLFPFGYGLSYTTFAYSNLSIWEEEDLVKGSVTVKNIGEQAGKAVIQVYAKKIDSVVERPEKELKTFEKVLLLSGEEKEVGFQIKKKDLAYYSVEKGQFVIESGRYEFMIGEDVDHICLNKTIELNEGE